MSGGDLLHKYAPGYPQGSPADIRAAATGFRTLASSVDSVFGRVGGQVNALTSWWQGSDRDAFISEWTNFSKAVTDTTTQITGVANQLDQLADQIEQAQRAYDAAAVAVGVTVVIGVALTVVTATASDEAAAGLVTAEVGSAAAVAEAATVATESALASILDALVPLLSRLVVFFGINVAAEGIAGAVVYPDHNPFNHINYISALEGAGAMLVLGGAGGFFGKFAAEGTAANFAFRVGGVGLTSAVLDATTQELTTGHINPVEVLFAGGTGGVSESVLAGGSLFRGFKLSGSATTDGGLIADIASNPNKIQAWNRYFDQKLANGQEPWSQERWSKQYDVNQSQVAKGDAFVTDQMKALNIVDGRDGWSKYGVPLPAGDSGRIWDLRNDALLEAYEFKSGSYPTASALAQLQKDQVLLDQGWRVTWVLNAKLSSAVMQQLEEMKALHPGQFIYNVLNP